MLPELKTILFCTQMGPNAAYIFRYALALAEKLSARIVALHVMETLDPRQEALLEHYVSPELLDSVTAREEKDAEQGLRKRIEIFCSKLGKGEDCEKIIDKVIVAEGHVPDQILRHVSAVGADLVVMGAHAESTLFDALVGNTAQKVIKGSPVPVLVVQVPEGKQDLTVTGV